MALLTLTKADGYGKHLPDACVRCGYPAAILKIQTMSSVPSWAIILILFGGPLCWVLGVLLDKRKTVWLPLCEYHVYHWYWRKVTLAITGAIPVILGFIFCAGVEFKEWEPLAMLSLLCCYLSIPAWIILAIVLRLTSIRASKITKAAITLRGIAPEFIEALEGQHQRPFADVDQLVRERWRDKHGQSRLDDHIQEDDNDSR